MDKGERKCIECEEYQQDYTCRGLADWLGQEFAEGCVSYKKLEGPAVYERMFEAWR